MITKEQINKIIKNISLKEVVSKYIKLEKVGENYRGFSPFNSENHPSFMVSENKKIWKDFSSGKGGNVITFIMYMENLSFFKSIIYLNDKYNLNIFKKNSTIYNNYKYYCYKYNKNLNIKRKIKNINYIYNIYFNKNLDEKKKKYLVNTRKINTKYIKKFNIGGCNNNNNNVSNIINFFKINNIKKKDLFKYNILKKKNDKIINIFNNSIIFPIYNIKKEILGFGARKLSGYIKYINSYESIIFKKSNILYGLNYSYKYIQKYNYCIITEGYIDLISLFKINIKNVVSTLGINISKKQLNIIKKITKNIIIIYDGDKAGNLATLKLIKILLYHSFNIKIFLLKKNYDIDDYINKKYNKHSYKKIKKRILNKCLNFLIFFKKYFKYEKQKKGKKYKIITKILKYINYVNNYIKKYMYINKISKIFNIKKSILLLQLLLINKNNYQNNKSLYNRNINNIYIDTINYKYNFIKNFYKKYILKKKKNIKKIFKNKYIKKKKKCLYYIEKFIIKFIITYNIYYFIYKKHKKKFFYIKNFFKKKKIFFLNNKIRNIYNNIIVKNCKYIFTKFFLLNFINKYLKYKIYNNKNIKYFCNIIYIKYKISILIFKSKNMNIYNKKTLSKIIKIKKKIYKYKQKIIFYENLCK
ncbi:MAG: DNA primase [Candidatus Shikimatogenerans sp. Tduv]|uniref:DNA primase n=1 Tax=Candidatus Shikimatogenerans sp. Tduv TaxID=3158567 RepID=A0AAU7QRK4_9FLAO